MPAIRVLVVDDSLVIRQMIGALLAQYPAFTVVGEASTGVEAIEMARRHLPDVVLLDIGLPELNGFQATPLVKNAAPNAEILIMSQHTSRPFVNVSFAMGARGFLDKRDLGNELTNAVTQVFLKKRYTSQSLQEISDSPGVPLSSNPLLPDPDPNESQS